ncbi:MAG: DHA2 family efflux MFS transporter permease subunit [Microbacteriaceae bacterium]|jgi:EmrB/QacA subfamily drug resistance transporter|nr:DHA2 family efflux MFS transporter permease subunit [Microbacteriaceae bacterium]
MRRIRGGLGLSIAIMLVSSFMGNFTQTQLSTALPQVVTDFHITVTVGQWLTSIFMLVLGVMVPMTAFLTRRFTTRQIVLVSMLVFTAGSFMAWWAPSFLLVMAGRILQAAGTSIIFPAMQIVIFSEVPMERRGLLMGFVGLVLSAAPAIGPTLGGWQTDAFGWRSIFLSLAVIGIVLFLAAWIFLGDYGDVGDSRIDVASVILSTLGFSGVLYGFTNIEAYHLASPMVWGPGIVGVISLAWFIHRQFHLEVPLLNLRVFRNRTLTVGTIATSMNFFAFSAFTVLLPIYLQSWRGISATASGLIQLPGALANAGIGLAAGALYNRLGARFLGVTGSLSMVIGSAMLIPISLSTPIWYIVLSQFIRMAGIGQVMSSLTMWSLNSLPHEDLSDGTAIINTLRQCMGAVGGPVVVVLMETVQQAKHHAGLPLSTSGAIGTSWAIVFSTVCYLIMLLISVIWVHGDRAGRAAVAQR